MNRIRDSDIQRNGVQKDASNKGKTINCALRQFQSVQIVLYFVIAAKVEDMKNVH